MNHLHLSLEKIKEHQKMIQDRSLGEILYGAIALKYKVKSFNIGDLFYMKDDELYGLLSRSFVKEVEDMEEEEEKITETKINQ